MATVFISQKVDLTDTHEHSLLNNANADSVIFLPESSGVNSAGQVLTVYGAPLNGGVFSSRYALVVTGQDGNGELTVAGNYDRHTSFQYTVKQELADSSLQDNPISPAKKWVQDEFKQDVYYETNASGEVARYLAIDPDRILGTSDLLDNQIVLWRPLTAAENMVAGQLAGFQLAVQDEQGNWYIPAFADPETGEAYGLYDLYQIYNGDRSVLVDNEGNFIFAENDLSGDPTIRLEYDDVTWVNKGSDSSWLVSEVVPLYQNGADFRDEYGRPVYDDVNGKRLPVLKDNGDSYRVDSTGQLVIQYMTLPRENNEKVLLAIDGGVIANDDKVIMVRTNEYGAPICYEKDTVNNIFKSYQVDANGDIIYYETGADGSTVKYETDENGVFLRYLCDDENGQILYFKTDANGAYMFEEANGDITYLTSLDSKKIYDANGYTYSYDLQGLVLAAPTDTLKAAVAVDSNCSDATSCRKVYGDLTNANITYSANRVWVDNNGQIIRSQVAVQENSTASPHAVVVVDQHGKAIQFMIYVNGPDAGEYVTKEMADEQKHYLVYHGTDTYNDYNVRPATMPGRLNSNGTLKGYTYFDWAEVGETSHVIFHDNSSDCEYEHRDAGNTYTYGNIMKRYFDPGLGKYVDRYFDPELGKYVNATDFGRLMVSDGSGYEELFQKDEFGREIRYKLEEGTYVPAYEEENNQIVYYWVYIDENGDRKVGGRAETLDNATGVQRLRTKKELDELMSGGGLGRTEDDYQIVGYTYDYDKSGLRAYDNTTGGGVPVPVYIRDTETNQVISYEGSQAVYYITDKDGEFVYFKADAAGNVMHFKTDTNGVVVTYQADDNGNLICYKADANGDVIRYEMDENQALIEYCADENGELLYFEYDHATGQLLKYYSDAQGNLTRFDADGNVVADGGSVKELTRYIADENGNIYYYNNDGERSTDPQFGTRREWSSSADGNWRYDESETENSFYQITDDSATGIILRHETGDAVIDGMINAQDYDKAGKVVAKYRADADGNIIWYETDGGEFVRYCAYEDGSLVYFESEGNKLIRYKSDANGNLLTDADGNYIAVTRYHADADGNIIYYNAAGKPTTPDKGEPKEWTEGSEGFWAYAEPAEGEYYFYKQVSGSANGQILAYDPADARLTQFDYGFNPIQYGGNAPANGAGWPVGENQDGAYADGATQQWQEGDGNYSHLTTTRYIADENGNIYYYNANGERSTDPQFGTRREWSSSADGNWAYDLNAGEMVEDANGGMIKVEVNGFDAEGNPIFADGVNGVKVEASKDAYGNYLSGKPEDGKSGSIIYYLTDENGDIIYFKADEKGKVIYYQTNSNGYVIHGANGRPVEQTKYIADEDGNFILDAAGNKQVWTSEADGNYEYDKENGAPLASKVIADRDGNAIFYVVEQDGDGNIYYLTDETGKRIVAEYGGKTYAAGDNAKYWAYDTVNGVPVEAPKDEYGNYISGKPLEKFMRDADGNDIYYKWDGTFVYEPGTTELQIAWKTDAQGREIYYEVLSDGTFGGLLTPKYVTDDDGNKLYFVCDGGEYLIIEQGDEILTLTGDEQLTALKERYSGATGLKQLNDVWYVTCYASAQNKADMYDFVNGKRAYDTENGKKRYDSLDGVEMYDENAGAPIKSGYIDENGIFVNQGGKPLQEDIDDSKTLDPSLEDGKLTTETLEVPNSLPNSYTPEDSGYNGTDRIYVDATYNINHTQYNGSEAAGAVLFAGDHNYLVLSAQSGAGNADIYHTAIVPDKGFENDGVIYKKTDDAIKIRSNVYGIYTYFDIAGVDFLFDSKGEKPLIPDSTFLTTVSTALHAKNTLTVVSDLAGQIESYAASLHTGYLTKPGSEVIGVNDARDVTTQAYGVKAKDLLLNGNFRAEITVANTREVFDEAMSYVPLYKDNDYYKNNTTYTNKDFIYSTALNPKVEGGSSSGSADDTGTDGGTAGGNAGSNRVPEKQRQGTNAKYKEYKYAGTTIVAFSNEGVRDNDISNYGIYTTNDLTMRDNSIWSGVINVATTDISLINNSDNWWVPPDSGTTTTMTNNTVSAYGVYVGGTLTIDTMGSLKRDDLYGDDGVINGNRNDYGDDWDQGSQSAGITVNLNNVLFDASNTAKISNGGNNKLHAAAIYADTIKINTVTSDVTFTVDASGNTADVPNTTAGVLYAAGLEAKTIELGRFDGTISVNVNLSAPSTWSYGGHGMDANTITVSSLLAGNITVGNVGNGFSVGTMITAGVIDTNIFAGGAIHAGKLISDGFTGNIGGYNPNTCQTGISISSSIGSDVAGDAFDIAGHIWAWDEVFYNSGSSFNLRISGDVLGGNYVVNVAPKAANADRLELAAGSRVDGRIELGLGGGTSEMGDANRLIVNSQASYSGNVYATGGTLALRFDLEGAAMDTPTMTLRSDIDSNGDSKHLDDETLSATCTFTINLNFAEVDQTYNLIKYEFDADKYWTAEPRKVAFTYQGFKADNVYLTRDVNGDAVGSGVIYNNNNDIIANATVRYDHNSNVVSVTVDQLDPITENIDDADNEARGSQLVYGDLWSIGNKVIDLSNLHRYLTTKLDAEKVLNIGGKELDRISSYLVTYSYTREGEATVQTENFWLHYDSKGNMDTTVDLASGVVVYPASVIISVNSEAATGEDPMTDCTTVSVWTNGVACDGGDCELEFEDENWYYSQLADNHIEVGNHDWRAGDDPALQNITLRSFENFVVTYIFFDENGRMLDKKGNVVNGNLEFYADYLKYGETIETRTLDNIEISHRDIPANAANVHYIVAVKGASDIALEIDETEFEGNGIIVNRDENEVITSIDWTFADQLWKSTINSTNQLSFNGLTINSIKAYKLVFTYTLDGVEGVAYTGNAFDGSDFVTGTNFDLSQGLFDAEGNALSEDAVITGYDLSIHGISKERISGVIDNNEAQNRFLENYDAENDALTISWHGLDNYSDINITEAKYCELEYIIYEADGVTPLSYIDANLNGVFDNGEKATSIVVTLDINEREYAIGGVKDGVRVDWRIRLINDGSATATTNWTDYNSFYSPSENISDFTVTNNTVVRDVNSTLAEFEGMVTAVSEIAWENTFTSEQTIREYEIEYVALSTNIKYSTVRAMGFDSLSEYISCNAGVNGIEDGLFADILNNAGGYDSDDAVIFSKTVTSTEAVLAELQDQSYIYWRVRAVDTNGAKSEWVDGKTFRVWAGERDENRPVFRDKTTALIGYSIPDVTVVNDKLTAPEDKTYTASIAWNSATDSQSQVRLYRIEALINGKYQTVGQVNSELDINKGLVTWTAPSNGLDDSCKYRVEIEIDENEVKTVDAFLRNVDGVLTLQWSADAEHIFQYTLDADGDKVWTLDGEGNKVLNTALTIQKQRADGSWETVEFNANELSGQFFDYSHTIKGLTNASYKYRIIAVDYFGNETLASGQDWEVTGTIEVDNTLPIFNNDDTAIFGLPRYSMPSENEYSSKITYSATVAWNNAIDPDQESAGEYGTYIKSYVIEVTDVKTKETVSITIDPQTLHGGWIASYQSSELNSAYKYKVRYTVGEGENATTVTLDAFVKDSNGIKSLVWYSDSYDVCSGQVDIIIVGAAGDSDPTPLDGNAYSVQTFENVYSISGLSGGEYTYQIKAVDYTGQSSIQVAGREPIIADRGAPIFAGYVNEVLWNNSYTVDVAGENGTSYVEKRLVPTFRWSKALDLEGDPGVRYYTLNVYSGKTLIYTDNIAPDSPLYLSADGLTFEYTIDPRNGNAGSGFQNGYEFFKAANYTYEIVAVDYFGKESMLEGSWGSSDTESPYGQLLNLRHNISFRADGSPEVSLNWETSMSDNSSKVYYRVIIADNEGFEGNNVYEFWTTGEQSTIGANYRCISFNNTTVGRPASIFEKMSTVYWKVDAYDSSYNRAELSTGRTSFTFTDGSGAPITSSGPGAPSNISVTTTKMDSDKVVFTDEIALSWSDTAAGLGTYRYVISLKDVTTGQVIATADTLDLSDYQATDMIQSGIEVSGSTFRVADIRKLFGLSGINDGRYEIAITAYDAQGRYASSSSEQFSVDTSRPGMVSFINQLNQGIKTVAVSAGNNETELIFHWNPVNDSTSGIRGYVLRYRPAGSNRWYEKFVETTSCSFNVTNDSTNWEYYITAIDGTGNPNDKSTPTNQFTNGKDLPDGETVLNGGIYYGNVGQSSPIYSLNTVQDKYGSINAATVISDRVKASDNAVDARGSLADQVGRSDRTDAFSVKVGNASTFSINLTKCAYVYGMHAEGSTSDLILTVYDGTTQIGESIEISAAQLNQSIYTNDNLESGKTYTFVISSANSDAVIDYTFQWEQTVTGDIDTWFDTTAAVTTVIDGGVNPGNFAGYVRNSAILSWDKIFTGSDRNIVGYEYSYTFTNEENGETVTETVTVTSKSDDVTFTGHGNVTWQVRALDSNGTYSDWIDGQAFRVLGTASDNDEDAPVFAANSTRAEVTRVTTNNQIDQKSAIEGYIYWNAADDGPNGSGVKAYEIEISTDGGVTYTKWKTVDAKVRNGAEGYDYAISISDIRDKQFTYRICAKDYKDNVSRYLYGNQIITDTTAPIFSNANVRVECNEIENTNTFNPVITWNEASDAAVNSSLGQNYGVKYYSLYFRVQGSDVWELQTNILNGDELTYTLPDGAAGLETGKVYEYKIVAYDHFGNASADVTGIFRGPDKGKPTGTITANKVAVNTSYGKERMRVTFSNGDIEYVDLPAEGAFSWTGSRNIYSGSSSSSSSENLVTVEIKRDENGFSITKSSGCTVEMVSAELVEASVELSWKSNVKDPEGSEIIYKLTVSDAANLNGNSTYEFWTTETSLVFGGNTVGRPLALLTNMNEVYWMVEAYDASGNASNFGTGVQKFDNTSLLSYNGLKIDKANDFKLTYQNITAPKVTVTPILVNGLMSGDAKLTLKNDADVVTGYYAYNITLKNQYGQVIAAKSTLANYNDQRSDDLSGATVSEDGLTVTIASLKKFFGLAAIEDGSYTLEVAACNGDGYTATTVYSQSQKLELDTTAPAQVEIIRAYSQPKNLGSRSQTVFGIEWSKSSDNRGIAYYEVNYRVYNSAAPGKWTQKNVGLATSFELDLNYSGSESYEFQVVAVDVNGNRSVVATDESVVIAPAFDKYNGSINQIDGITRLNWSDEMTLTASNVVGTEYNLDDVFKFTTGGDACAVNLICDSLEKHNGYNAALNVMIYKVSGQDFWGNDILTLVSNNVVWDASRVFSNKMFDANSTYVVKVTNTNPYNSVYEYSLHFERKDYVCDNKDDSIDKVFANNGNNAYTLTEANDANNGKVGRVGFGDTVDYMYFDPVASGKYTFSLSGVASSAIMYVYEYNGTWNRTLAAVSASAWNVDGVKTHELILDANKQYFVAVVDGLGGYTAGTEYTVSVNPVEIYQDATTGDDTVEKTTSSITVVNGVSNCWVGFGDLNDYHRIDVNDTHGAVINISVSHKSTEGPLVAYVWQDNGYGQLALVGYQYLGTGVNSVSTGALYLAGDSSRSCYLQITAPNGAYGYNSTYQITTSGYDITDALVNDSNNERNQNIAAVAVNSAADSTGWVGSGDAIDYWKLENANGGIYNITINRPVEYADFGNIVTVTVWRENGYGGYTWYRGITLYKGDNSESTGDFYLEAAGDKNYYIEVSAPYAAYGWNSHYSLDVNSRDVETNDNANNDKEGALTVNVNNATPVSGWVGVTDARDCYKVEGIESGESYTINLTGINGSEIYASLGYYNTWGQFVALYTKLGAYKADSMSLSMTIPSYYADLAAQNGGFYLQVNANGNSGYELQINDNQTLAGASAADDLGGALAALNAGIAVAGWVGLGYQKDIRTVGTADAGLYDLRISGVANPVQVIVYKDKYAVKSMVVSAGDGVIENLLLPGNNGEYSIEVNALYAAYGMNTGYSIELDSVADTENIEISNINSMQLPSINLAGGTAVFYSQVSEAGGAYNFNFSGTIKAGTAVMNVYEMLANGTQRFVRQLVLNNYIAEAESGSLFLDDSANVFSTGIYKFEVVSYGGDGTVNIECSGYDVTNYIANKDAAFEFGVRDWVGKGDAEDVKTGVTVANDGIYSFNFSGINGNNLYFQVIDESTGWAVASFYPAYGCTDTTYSCALKANASYKLVVRSLDGGYNCFSEYTMSAPVLRGIDSDNNTAGNACSILDEAANVPVEGWVGNGDTIDYIKLELDSNTVAGKYDIGFAGLQNGVYATLYEQTAYGLAFVANKYVTAADNSNSLSGLNLVDGKEYYLSVSALAGNGYYDSEYSVSVTRTRDYTGLTASSIIVDETYWNNDGVYETVNWVGFCNTSDVYNLGELQGAVNITLTLGNASDAYADETGNLYVTLWRCNSYGTRIEALGTYAAYTWNSSVASGDICINSGDTYSYQIEVNGYGVNSDYTLQVENWDCSSFTTANNNLGAATRISLGEEHAVSSAVWNYKYQGDMVDFYKFSVSGNGGSYTIHLDNANSNVRVWLYNSYGAAMQVGYVAQATGEVNLSANLSAGEYYVAVENYTYSTASHYELTVDKNPVNNSDDTWQKVAANVNATLYRADAGTNIEDWVGFGDAVDVFKVMTDSNGQLVFGGNNDVTDEALSKREITLSLVDANGNWVSLNFNSENGEYTTATTLMADSEYYLAINSTQPYAKNNTYSITVNKKH